MRCWGNNGNGELGDGTNTQAFVPVKVLKAGGGDFTGVKQISAAYHTCALLSDSSVWCWGRDSEGELLDGTTGTRGTPAPALAGPGTPLSGVLEVSVNLYTTCVVMSDHTARCGGYNGYGELGDGSTTTSYYPVSVRTGGGAVLAGVGSFGPLTSGYLHRCVALQNGTAECWGYGNDGELGDGTNVQHYLAAPVYSSGTTPLTNVTQISDQVQSSCARLADGTVRCWGYNYYGELGNASTASSAYPVQVQNDAGNLGGVVEIASGWIHACARDSSSGIWCWGYDGSGQLGSGTTSKPYVAVPLVW